MTIAIIFKPGDTLTAEQINTYLAEHAAQDVADLENGTQEAMTSLESAWKKAQTDIQKLNWIKTGGNL